LYQALIDAAVQERSDAHNEKRGSDTGEWHPSSMTECLRQAVYSYRGEPVTNPSQMRNLRIMDRGTEVHEVIQDLMHDRYPGFESEIKVNALGVKGSCDGLLPIGEGFPYNYGNEIDDVDQMQPVYELQEYKSISPMGKRYLNGPKEGHVKQARIYYAALEDRGYLLDGIRIVYFDRDDWSVIEFEVEPWTVEGVESFKDELEDLQAHADEGTLPAKKRPDSKNKMFWLCRYCPYADTCGPEGK